MLQINEIGSISERITKLVEHFCQGNKTAFGRAADIQSGVLAGIVGGRESKPGFEILQKLMTAYPTVEPIWLLFGRGPMLTTESENSELNREAPVGHSQLLMDMVKKEVAEQMAEARPNEDVYKLLNDEMAQTRAQYALSWEEEADALRKKRDAFGDAQISTAFELTSRIEEIERAISVLENIKPGPNGLAPSIAYRVGPKPDFSKPFDGLLSRRLNISESEAKELVTSKTGVGFSAVTTAPGYGYEVSEVSVQNFLRWHAHHLKQS